VGQATAPPAWGGWAGGTGCYEPFSVVCILSTCMYGSILGEHHMLPFFKTLP
jgi:hypothetical protein